MRNLAHLGLLALLALSCLASAGNAMAAGSNRIAGMQAAVHGAPELSISSCIYPDAEGNALFLAYVENISESQAPAYTVTLHSAKGELLLERSFTTMLPGESRAIALRLDNLQSHIGDLSPPSDGNALCNDGE